MLPAVTPATQRLVGQRAHIIGQLDLEPTPLGGNRQASRIVQGQRLVYATVELGDRSERPDTEAAAWIMKMLVKNALNVRSLCHRPFPYCSFGWQPTSR